MANLSKKIGSYEILEELGHSDFATVYLAQDERSNRVVLKVLNPHAIRNQTRVERFKQEARIIGKLNHPNIIQLINLEENEGTLFIVMEYIPGGTLRKRLEDGPLPRNEAVHIVRRIGSALTCAHLHEDKIIHRDIKPENILLDINQEPVRPVLTDFGVAKLLSMDDLLNLTTTGNFFGTPYYMAPEVSNQEPLTPAVDLYALAVTCFEMLAGQRPFEADSPVKLLEKHQTEPRPLLSHIAPDMGSFFDEILARAMAVNSADRFQNVADFIEALEAANNEAEQTEKIRIEQQNQAITAVKLTQAYVQKDDYNPARALEMIGLALDYDPENVKALRILGKIHLDQMRFAEALGAYKKAYEQVRDISSEVGMDYLQALRKVADIFWQDKDWPEAAKHYHEIKEILGANEYEDIAIQEIWKETRSRLIEFHYGVGDKAFALGSPENLDGAIEILGRETQWLRELKADRQSEELNNEWKLLQIRRYEEKIRLEEEAVREMESEEGDNTDLKYEGIIQHYLNIDEYYRNLIKLEPKNIEWKASRRKKLKEQAEHGVEFATQAVKEPEPNYDIAIQHYKAIRNLDQTDYPGLSKELNLNLDEIITDLEEKADYHSKYQKIQDLMAQRRHPEALRQLDVDFISKGNYEYQDVAQMLWGLVYAKQHEGQFPEGWGGVSGIEVLSAGLVRAERVRIDQFRVAFKPWSNFSERIDEQLSLLLACETGIKKIEAKLSEAKAPEKILNIDDYRRELTKVKGEIEAWRTQLQHIETNITPQKIETWLQKIDEIETSLKEYYRLEEIQESFNQNDKALEAIEEDPLFAALQTLASTSIDVRRTTHKMQAQFIDVLVAEGQRREDSLKQKIKQKEKQYNMFAISLIPALIVGGAIGILITLIIPEVQNSYLVVLAAMTALLSFWGGWFYFRSRN